MPFLKLDCNILDSSLWIDHDARNVFLTALLLARPQAYDEPIPTIQTRTLDSGEYVVPPGIYGFVGAASVGLAARAGVGKEAALSALERLAEPEADSRTPDHEGRRLVRVSGGFLVLNFDRYHKQDLTNAERQKRFYNRQKQKKSHLTIIRNPNAPNGVRTVSLTSELTQAEAEAEVISPSLRSGVSEGSKLPSSPPPQAEGGQVGKSGKPLTEAQKAKLAALETAKAGANEIMRRKPATPWAENEKAALRRHIAALTSENLALVLRYYRAGIPEKKDIRRKGMLALLNNFPGEVDRAQAFFRANPSQPGDRSGGPSRALPPEWEHFVRSFRLDDESLFEQALAWKTWAEIPQRYRSVFSWEAFHVWNQEKGATL